MKLLKKRRTSIAFNAFANSDGGVIIYGAKEYDKAGMTIITVPFQRKIEDESNN